MDILEQSPTRVLLKFPRDELDALSDTIIKNAERFGSATLNLAYLLKEQGYRMKNDFSQPPHAFGD